ncbi:serine/threonine protein kinase [Amycolatopsis vancoresmycina DSM 44592]|uniref:Serine/threonine protein kinase n=1 Tax=Amycolatopsis vancoresmycina DSM 44592 TaxID=1292037 RepID=R1HQB2_9PSEU|nr:serine/threonine protein kinase [Amycolatopsis vancoresmycina DSM 44592]
MTAPPPVLSQARPGLPPGLDAVVARGMAKRPADRYPTASAFADAVRAALTAPAPPFPTWQKTLPGPVPHTAPAPMTPPRPMPLPTAPRPGPFTGPPPAVPPAAKPRRNRWIALCAALAGIVVVALVITYVVTRDRTTQTAGPGPSTPDPATTSEAGSSPPPTETTSDPPSTSESKPPHDTKLRDALPAVYKGETCTDAAPSAGAVAAVECTDSTVGDVHSGNVILPQPTGARFLRFADAGAMNAFFQDVVKTQGLTRNDAQGACRPKKVPKIWGTYYRAETPNPLPGDYLTCFLGDPAQLVWTDGQRLLAGVLLSTRVTGNDELDKLYYWWNEQVLSRTAQG